LYALRFICLFVFAQKGRKIGGGIFNGGLLFRTYFEITGTGGFKVAAVS
jgi:hypothetical protein